MKSLLIEDTTVDERMQIVKEALGGFGNCDFSQQHAGAVKAEDREKPSGCVMH